MCVFICATQTSPATLWLARRPEISRSVCWFADILALQREKTIDELKRRILGAMPRLTRERKRLPLYYLAIVEPVGNGAHFVFSFLTEVVRCSAYNSGGVQDPAASADAKPSDLVADARAV
jgi:hypothetical protein